MNPTAGALEAVKPTPSPHELNTRFSWNPVAPRRPRFFSPAQLAAFDEHGFIIARQALSQDLLDAVEAAIDPLERQHDQALRTNEYAAGSNAISSADTITFTTHLVTRSPFLRTFAAHPVFRDICTDLIGERVRLYWDQSVYKKSGRPQEFPWHQDNGYTFVEPQQACSFNDTFPETVTSAPAATPTPPPSEKVVLPVSGS